MRIRAIVGALLAVSCILSTVTGAAAGHGPRGGHGERLHGRSGDACSTPPPEPQRRDCGYVGITQQECQQKGCCWLPVNPNPSETSRGKGAWDRT